MPSSIFDFFDIITFIFPILFFGFIGFFIYVTVLAFKENARAGRVRKYVSSQMDDVFSRVNSAIKPEEEKKKEKHSRSEFFNMQKDYAYKNVDSYANGKEILKDKNLSEAEKNVLYGK